MIRKMLLSLALGAAVFAGSMAVTSEQNKVYACPSDSKIGLAAGAAAVGYIGWNTTMGVSEVGAPIGIIAFGLYNNYCTTGSMFKAAPVTYAETIPGAGYHVASLHEQMANNPELAIEVAMWEKANPGSTALAAAQ